MNEVAFPSKITSGHLARWAYIYVRQSTEQQVRFNTESQRLQLALVERARGLGFSRTKVIDSDLGSSAALGAAPRPGFDAVLSAVARGEVGIVFALDLSRLSRTDRDFCRLIELCQVFDTLLGDAEHLYDPAQMDDQLVLGIKGTLSVVELRVLRMRLIQGMRNKAARGEFQRLLPTGYAYDADGRVVKDPDERIHQAIASIFKVFRRTWSIRQTTLWYHQEGVVLPVRAKPAGREPVVWRLPNVSFVGNVLRNPCYAGAYTWGVRPMESIFRDGRVVRRQGCRLPAEESAVFLRDHHEGYITWEQYEEHRRIMNRNSRVVSGSEASAVRSGQALLAGLLRCGRCGRRLHVHYWGKSGMGARYLCTGTYDTGGKYCLGFGERGVDKAFSAEVLRVLSPLGVQASERALQRRAAACDERRRSKELKVQQLEYEARRAFEQYNEVDPRNRLVAGELERRWNVRLEELTQAQCSLQSLAAESAAMTDEDHRAIEWFGQHFEAVWTSRHCPPETKKQVLRTLIEEVVVNLDEATGELRFIIHWRGGSHTEFRMTKPLSGSGRPTDAADIDLIRSLADRYCDDRIALVLNRLGRQTGKGLRWTRERVKSARSRAGIPGHERPVDLPGLLNQQAAARHCGVSDTTIRRLVEAGLVKNLQTIPWAPWEIPMVDLESERVRRILSHLRETGRLVLELARSDQQGNLFEEFQGGSNDS